MATINEEEQNNNKKKKKKVRALTEEEQTTATIIAPKEFSPIEDAENIKKACLGYSYFNPYFVNAKYAADLICL